VRAFYLDWRPRFKPDRRLAGKVTIRGDVFVFNKPFPILERAPQVSFRGLWRINGDSLIEQIGKHRSRKRLIVTVHSCGPGACPLPDAIVTKQQLADCLATGVRLNRSFVDHFLSELATTARVQLLHHRRFKLPGIGTLLIRGSRDPSVRFQPSTRMWRSQRSQRRGRARAGLCFYSYKNIAQTAKMRKRGKPLKEIKLLSELLLSLANRLAVRRGRSPIKATQSALTRRYQPLVKRLYDGLRALAQDELKRGNDFRLPAIGRFSIGSH
jgi:nucleoid DNA-binding protein